MSTDIKDNRQQWTKQPSYPNHDCGPPTTFEQVWTANKGLVCVESETDVYLLWGATNQKKNNNMPNRLRVVYHWY